MNTQISPYPLMLRLPYSLLSAGLISLSAFRAVAQTTNVTCVSSFGWANNLKGQSPCLVAAYLQAQCFPNKQWDVPALPPGKEYLAPTGNVATACACASPVYSLLSACAACQGASYLSWGQWTANCPSAFINNGTFPFQIPEGTSVPQWAMSEIHPDASFDIEAAQGGGSNGGGLSGAVTFLIILLPIVLLSLLGFGGWVLWKRKYRRPRAESNASQTPLLRHTGGSRNTILTVNTGTSDVHIHLMSSSKDTGRSPSPYEKSGLQPSPTPTTPEPVIHSAHTSPSSPGHQYAYYPETPAYQPHQPFLAPPSAGATSTGFPVSYHTSVPSQSQPPLTGATTNTFASQMDRSHYTSPGPVEVENDSGTFPRTPIEPQLPSLPFSDPRHLLPPSVRANVPGQVQD